MLNAAIVGLGWWGGTLVDAVQGGDLMRFTAAATRKRSDKDHEFARSHDLKLASYDELLADPDIHAIVLATPPAGHRDQIVAAAKAGKHVFCEKPFAMSRAEAEESVAAMDRAGKVLGLGYNRRFHPSLDRPEEPHGGGRARDHPAHGMHHERAQRPVHVAGGLARPADQAPCGGLFPMGVHAVDGFIDLAGEIDQAFCQSLHRAAPVENDDTTSILLHLKAGMSAYLGTMTATVGAFRFAVYGSKAMAQLGGATHVAGQSSHQRRAGLFGSYMIQPVKGETQWIEVPEFDVNKAELEAFAKAAAGGAPYPIPTAQMIQGVAATDAIVASARSGKMEKVA